MQGAEPSVCLDYEVVGGVKPRRQRHSSFSREDAYENVVLLDANSNVKDIVAGPRREKDTASFLAFAADNFQAGNTHVYSKQNLKEPLLPLANDDDKQAALSVWRVIQRFMGDQPDAPRSSQSANEPFVSVMSRIRASMNPRALPVTQHGRKGSEKGRGISRWSITGQRKEKSPAKPKGTHFNVQVVEETLISTLDKVQYIAGKGIVRPQLRDEIYCQICKQLTDNPSKDSHARGWILLALCLGCFEPSEKFTHCLEAFIQGGPPAYSPYCLQRLSRTHENGARRQPPTWLELHTCKEGKPLVLDVMVTDGKTRTLECDSATTVDELVSRLAETLGLKDTFGFSIYIGMFGKVVSLGSGKEHLLDDIYLCEQYTRETGNQEDSASWRLYFRKEIFAPWHDVAMDPTSTNLIYRQIVNDIHLEEYTCGKEEDLATIAAQCYYINHGPDMDETTVKTLLPTVLPKSKLTSDESYIKWTKLVTDTFNRSVFAQGTMTAREVKGEVVTYAMNTWPLSFSRLFEASRVSGPPLPENDVIIAVNSTGLHVLNSDEDVLLKFFFPEILGVSCTREDDICGGFVTFSTFDGEEYVFSAPYGQDLSRLITTFVQELKARSQFAVALNNYKALDSIYLNLNIGDVIELKREQGEIVLHSGCYYGKNLDAGGRGYFKTECAYVLPTVDKPTLAILGLLKLKGQEEDSPQHVKLKKRISICI